MRRTFREELGVRGYGREEDTCMKVQHSLQIFHFAFLIFHFLILRLQLGGGGFKEVLEFKRLEKGAFCP